jgi:hypothetical protein
MDGPSSTFTQPAPQELPARQLIVPPPIDCPCAACETLRAEVPTNFPWLRRKLLHRGWAGKTSPAEKGYQRAHAPWAVAKGAPTVAQQASRHRLGVRDQKSSNANWSSWNPPSGGLAGRHREAVMSGAAATTMTAPAAATISEAGHTPEPATVLTVTAATTVTDVVTPTDAAGPLDQHLGGRP